MKTLLTLLMLTLLIPSVFARETGEIFGVVTEKVGGKPIAYANVVVVGTKIGCMTLSGGTYRIVGVPVGIHTVKAMMMGYKPMERTGIKVGKSAAVEVNFELEETIVGRTQEIVVEGTYHQVEVSASDIIKRADKLQVRGGRPSERYFRPPPCEFPPSPAHPCRGPGRFHNTEEYGKIYENSFLEALSNPLSTFSIDVDVASYGNTRRFIMHDQLPPKDAVRIEEFINYFNYDYEKPHGDDPFSINLEYSRCPWNAEHGLVHIGLKGRELEKEDQKPSNLVFLIDVSGSMRPANKLPLLRKAFLLLVDQLKDEDRISIVVYAGAAGLVLPSTPGSEREKIRSAIGMLHAGGSTAGCAGIKLAYKVAKEHYIRGGNNRVILATDGDFNVGVSSTAELIDLIEKRREDGIFLTVLGFGMGNYKDQRLEQIADKATTRTSTICSRQRRSWSTTSRRRCSRSQRTSRYRWSSIPRGSPPTG
jgi:Ca-activated chloride channel family protein